MTLGVARLGEETDFPFEVSRLAEILVDTGEPDVSNFITGPQPIEDRQANLLAADIRSLETHGLLDLGRDGLELII